MIDINKIQEAIYAADNTEDLDRLMDIIEVADMHSVNKEELTSRILWRKQLFAMLYMENPTETPSETK